MQFDQADASRFSWRLLRRRFFFPLLAIALALSPVAILEVALWSIGWEEDHPGGDPFVGFSSRPLFLLDDDTGRFAVATERLDFFRPDSFLAKKPPHQFRVFCLGGSTVQGRPYAIETAFSTFLELSLRSLPENRDARVINCGGVSYASYRLAPILEEVLGYSPDLIVLYTGHNEFLEDRSYSHLKNVPEIFLEPLSGLAGLRSLRWISSMIRPGERDMLPTPETSIAREVDALLDHGGGLERYHRDDEWRRGVVAHFRHNLRRMIRMAEKAGVPLIVVNPPSNSRHCPPFKSENSRSLSAEQVSQVARLLALARDGSRKHPDTTMAQLLSAVEIDPRNAILHFELARRYDARGRFESARRHYARASEEDVCPLRIIEGISAAIRDIVSGSSAMYLDLRSLVIEQSEGNIPGDNWFLDHVHPSIEGHQQISDLILEIMANAKMVSLPADWRQRSRDAHREHLSQLDTMYFQSGRRRLENLRYWSRGRAGERPMKSE